MPRVRWYVGSLTWSREAKGRSSQNTAWARCCYSEVCFLLPPLITCFAISQEEFCSAVPARSIKILFVSLRLDSERLIGCTTTTFHSMVPGNPWDSDWLIGGGIAQTDKATQFYLRERPDRQELTGTYWREGGWTSAQAKYLSPFTTSQPLFPLLPSSTIGQLLVFPTQNNWFSRCFQADEMLGEPNISSGWSSKLLWSWTKGFFWTVGSRTLILSP